MAILPVSTSRVSEPLKNLRLLYQLNADQLAIQSQYSQLSTGKRITHVSDDPAAAGRAFILQRGISRVEQLSRNASVTDSFYTATDSALNKLDSALIEARGATVEAAQNVLSDDERTALSLTIRSALDSSVAAANSIFRDQRLIGGVLQNADALKVDQTGIVFSGTDAVAKTQIGGGELFSVGVTANDALSLANKFYQGSPLSTGLDRDSRLIDLKNGQGVSPGLLHVSGGGNFVDVDLRSASSIGDVVDVLNAVKLNGRSLQATIQPDGLTVGFADGQPGTLAIDDAAGDTLAKDLSILNRTGATAPPLVSTGLAPRVTEGTLLTKLNGGAGINVSAGIQLQQGGSTFTIDLSQAKTVSDVLVAINRSGADVRAELDSSTGGISIRALRNGVDYAIGENGGTVATALGIRTATGATKLSDLDRGRGVIQDATGPEFSIIRPDGVQLDIDLSSANTVDDVINLIKNHPLNQGSTKIVASYNSVGNGIQLLAPPGASPIKVKTDGASNAAELLGFVTKGQTEAVGITSGPYAILKGSDYNPKEAGGTIDTLMRLETAIRGGDTPEIARLQIKLDGGIEQSTRTRGRVGIWSQNVQDLKATADDQATALKGDLSTEVDADLATVISNLQQRQSSLEASLKLIGQTAKLSLLDYL